MNDDFNNIEEDLTHEIESFNDLERAKPSRRRRDNAPFYAERYGIYAWIEKFVIDACKTQKPASWIETIDHQRKKLHKEYVTIYYPLLNRMSFVYQENATYSPYVQAYFEVSKRLGFLAETYRWQADIYREPIGHNENCMALFNRFVWELREHCSSIEFASLLKRKQRLEDDRIRAVKQWDEDLFRWRSRHLFLHFTFEYDRAYRDEITLDIVKAHLRRFLHNRSTNEILSGILHYVLCIEEGDEVGLHVHMIMAYDGQSRQDQTIGKYICEYWARIITQGKGYAHSDNFYKKSRERRGLGDGTGQINHCDFDKREALMVALEYLCKRSQLVRYRAHSKVKTFFLSQVPEPTDRGRSRAVSQKPSST